MFTDIIDRTPMPAACIAAGLHVDAAEALIARTLSQFTPTHDPTITHMLGIPGSGKSTHVRTLTKDNTLVISFDQVMEALGPYQTDAALHGAVAAFEKWEIPARMIGYEILHRAVATRLNIIFDHGGTRHDHVDFLRAIKEKMGYRVQVIYVPVDADTASTRVTAREKDSGRHTPLHYIPERFAMLQNLLPLYRAVADDFITLT